MHKLASFILGAGSGRLWVPLQVPGCITFFRHLEDKNVLQECRESEGFGFLPGKTELQDSAGSRGSPFRNRGPTHGPKPPASAFHSAPPCSRCLGDRRPPRHHQKNPSHLLGMSKTLPTMSVFVHRPTWLDNEQAGASHAQKQAEGLRALLSQEISSLSLLSGSAPTQRLHPQLR